MSVFAVIMDQCLHSVFMKMSGRLDGNLLNYLVMLYTNHIIYKDFSKIHSRYSLNNIIGHLFTSGFRLRFRLQILRYSGRVYM